MGLHKISNEWIRGDAFMLSLPKVEGLWPLLPFLVQRF
jgi:hypothetical protein